MQSLYHYKIRVEKDTEPKKLQYEKYKIFRKNYQVYQCFKYFFLVPWVLKTHIEMWGGGENTQNEK